MLRYLCSDATPLSTENIQDIIKAKNSMKQAPEAMANKYKISIRRVYQIWREVHPPTSFSHFIQKKDNSEKKNIIAPQIKDQGNLKRENLVNISIPPELASTCVEEGGTDLKKNIIVPQIEDQEVSLILSEPGSEGLNISQEDLIAFYKKEAIQDKKNIAKLKSILAK